MKRLLTLAGVAFLVASCGSETPTAPSIAQVGGLWGASSRITSAIGADCVSTNFSVGGTTDTLLQITQNGSSLTAVATSTSSGNSINYTGTAGTGSIVLNANVSNSGAFTFGYRCLNGTLRDLQLTAGTISATVNGNTGSGTLAESYNVLVDGTSTTVGTLTLNSAFSMTRQ